MDTKVNNKKVLLFGTSAGGLPALQIAKSLPGAKVWAGNIQTLAYKHSAFKKMLPVLFPNKSEDECIRDYPNRFEASKINGNNELYYFQNKSDIFHYRNHFLPYKRWYMNASTKTKVRFFEYDDPVSGHGSIGRKSELQLIYRLLNDEPLVSDWFYEI